MIYLRILLFSILCLTILSCSNKKEITHFQKENSYIFNDSLSLKEKGLIKLPLDSITTFWHYSANISNSFNDAADYFSFLNSQDKSITYFDLKDKISKKVYLNEDGENGIGFYSDVMVHLMIDKNDFYVYNAMSGRLFNIDSSGVVKEKFMIVDYEHDGDVPFPEPSGSNPIIKVGDDLYFSCNLNKQRNNFDNYGMILKYNLKNNSKKYILPLSNDYNKAFWGSPYRYVPNLTYNPKEKALIINYPISPYVFKSDLKGVITDSIYVGSKFFEEVKYMDLNIDYILSENRDFKNEDMFSFSNSDYAKTIYDEYNNLYYRFTYLRPELEEVKRGNTMPDFSIIICDENFKKIGETKFSSDQFDVSMTGVTKEGLLIARRDLYNLNDNEFTFNVFGPSKIK